MLKNVKYIKTTHTLEEFPQDDVPEIVIVGRSNVGKSSFINAITNHNGLAYVGKRPGKTRALSIFDVDKSRYRIIDVPGYGFAKVSAKQKRIFSEMIDTYLMERENIHTIVILIDSRRGVTDIDKDMLDYLLQTEKRFVVIGTKMDKVNQSEQHKFKVQTKEYLHTEPVMFSSLTKRNLDKVVDLIDSLV